MTRKFFLYATAFLSLSLLFSFSYKAANFSGTWNLDESASELGQFGARGAYKKIIIDQSNEAIKMILSRYGFDGNVYQITETYFVGKESRNKGVRDIEKVSILNWEGDQRFKIDSKTRGELSGQSYVFTVNEKWEISIDRKTLTIYSISNSPYQEEVTSHKAVYRKG
jgi:hypothetical protein